MTSVAKEDEKKFLIVLRFTVMVLGELVCSCTVTFGFINTNNLVLSGFKIAALVAVMSSRQNSYEVFVMACP